MTYGTTELNPGTGGDKSLKDAITLLDGAAAPTGAVAQMVKLVFGAEGQATSASSENPMPVDTGQAQALTDTQLRASPVPVSGTLTSAGTTTNTPVTPTQTFTNSAASTNSTLTKGSAGTVWSVVVSNINAAARYLKLYNKATAPTVGTDTPVIVIPIPAGQVVQIDGGSNGIRFGTGIGWALTASAADSDTTAVAANEHKVAIAYT